MEQVKECCCFEIAGDNPECRIDHEREQHARHRVLHTGLDELVADFITHTGKRPSETTVVELLKWSGEQTEKPTEKPS